MFCSNRVDLLTQIAVITSVNSASHFMIFVRHPEHGTNGGASVTFLEAYSRIDFLLFVWSDEEEWQEPSNPVCSYELKPAAGERLIGCCTAVGDW